jgi:UDPglucose 6-dehydrogenase
MRALIKTGQVHGAQQRVVEAAAAVNEARKSAMARKIANAVGGDVRGKVVAILGLTFKPNTDDMRDAPAIPIVMALNDMGAIVRAYDPQGMEQARSILPDVTYCSDAYQCAEGSHVLVIITEWEQFRALDLSRLGSAMAQPILVDLRRVYRAEEAARFGFSYHGVGKSARLVTSSEVVQLTVDDPDHLDPTLV